MRHRTLRVFLKKLTHKLHILNSIRDDRNIWKGSSLSKSQCGSNAPNRPHARLRGIKWPNPEFLAFKPNFTEIAGVPTRFHPSDGKREIRSHSPRTSARKNQNIDVRQRKSVKQRFTEYHSSSGFFLVQTYTNEQVTTRTA
jgi:hypothetical protein